MDRHGYKRRVLGDANKAKLTDMTTNEEGRKQGQMDGHDDKRRVMGDVNKTGWMDLMTSRE